MNTDMPVRKAECLMCGIPGGQQCADWQGCKLAETLAGQVAEKKTGEKK